MMAAFCGAIAGGIGAGVAHLIKSSLEAKNEDEQTSGESA
jgi:hypothetical protein